ncbi:TIGR01440 family protein [Cytobacillus sp. IB215665]|uniref:TIGR01440 family protein n=1 Tax=Cytobacillus sp. IB215665 TaxID=3097357 RepID=UPI002A12C42E|nr:TIGR01440 family protein [Cytobacillus sp. IB215665]MDX8363686.1 TIGR01440 family protein [Cytobacillus sp. IB215665]
MSAEILKWQQQLHMILSEFQQIASLGNQQLLVVGCSTSEILGERIGTSGTMEVAEMVVKECMALKEMYGLQIAFQCCEHLNRALVVERQTALEKQLTEVTVTPIRSAGGSVPTYAYHHFADPVVVEFIKADAGIDIGDTFIGMHIKHVAVPVRCSINQVGHAHVTLAKSRPKLIGGERAVYASNKENKQC